MFNAEEYISEYQQYAHGEPRVRALKKAIQAADEAKNDEWSFRFRDRLMHDSVFDTDAIDAMVIFPEMIALYDGNEELQADDDYLHMLLWDYKWVIGDIAQFTNIPLSKIEELLEDFRVRLEQNGKSLRPYVSLRETVSMTTHNMLPAEEYGKARELPVDDLKDCKACEAAHDVRAALLLDQREKAEKFSEGLFNGELHCAEQPACTYGNWLEYDIKHGDYAHGRKIAKRLFPMIRHDMAMLEDNGTLMHFYAVTDRGAGFTVFRRELRNYMNSRNHIKKFGFAHGAYRLFLHMQTEELSAFLPAEFPLYNSEHTYQTAELRDYFYEEAKKLADKFDARNGNTAMNDMLAAEDPPYDEEAVDLIHGDAPQAPSVIAAVCDTLPDELTIASVTQKIDSDGRFKVVAHKADEEHGVLGFQIACGDGSEEIYSVMLVVQPVPPVQEFRPANPIADGVYEAIEKAEGVVMCAMPFEEKQPDLAYHFQLKLMHLLVPGAIAYFDISRRKLLAAGWVALEAVSDVPPLVDYLYNLHLSGTQDNDYLWITTNGLRCCGLREIEILDATKENYPRFCDMLCFAAERILLRNEMTDAGEPFTVLRKADNSSLVCTWVPASVAEEDYPEDDAAGMALRREGMAEVDPEEDTDDAVLYLYDADAQDELHARKRLNTLTQQDFEQFRYGTYIASSRKIAALARERYYIFRSLFDKLPENAYVCVQVETEEDEDEIWIKVTDAGETEITGTLADDCLVGKAGAEYKASPDALTDFSVRVDEQLVILPDTAYIGLELDI